MDHVTDFDGWFPIRLFPTAQGYSVDWIRLGEDRFTEPFFTQSVQKLIRKPFHQAFRRQCSIQTLVQWASGIPAIAPDGLVFHTSRCGSTLISQMLNSVPGCANLSEPPPLDSALQMAISVSVDPALKLATIRALATAWARAFRLADQESKAHSLVIKADAWSVFGANLVRAVWPETPWVLLYRNPVEVVVSQLNNRAAYMIPGVMGLNLTGLPVQQAYQLSPEEYVTRSVGGVLTGIGHASRDSKAILVNYCELPSAIEGRIAPHFGIGIPPACRVVLNQASTAHAKEPSMTFSPDSATKQRAASPVVTNLVEQWALPQYHELEQQRSLAAQSVEPMNMHQG